MSWQRPAGVVSAHSTASTNHLEDLRAQAQYARRRYQLYKAKTYGQWPTSPTRLHEFQRACEQAEARLRSTEADAKHARDAAED
jgi:hypothetical protein